MNEARERRTEVKLHREKKDLILVKKRIRI